MSEVEIIEVIRSCNEQITTFYGQVISITFAMILAIYYFLNRAPVAMKLLSFIVYLTGMLMYVGLMLEESNVKRVALSALANLDHPSEVASGVVALHHSWLFTTTAVFLNAGLWLLILATCLLLFVWRRPEPSRSA